MPLSIATLKDTADWPSKELLIEIEAFLNSHYEFRCNDKYKGFFGKIKASFDRYEAEKRETGETFERYTNPSVIFHSDPFGWDPELDKVIAKEADLKNSFSTALMKLIKEKGKTNVEVYKRANIDRKLFSKISRQIYYIPSKKTIIALALALELSLDETTDLLKRGGFTLSRSILFDVIIEYFILHSKYDIFEINEVLAAHKQPTMN